MGFDMKLNDSLNNYSRAVTRELMEEAPEDLTYVYIGPIDSKTRPFCMSAAAQGDLTKEQILSLGLEYANHYLLVADLIVGIIGKYLLEMMKDNTMRAIKQKNL